LFEPKSAKAPDVSSQFLKMMMQLWDQHREKLRESERDPAHRPTTKQPPKYVLPFVLPILVSNQKGPWHLPKDAFRSQFRCPDFFVQWLPCVPVIHVSLPDDLTGFDQAVEKLDRDLSAALQAMVLTTQGIDEAGLERVLTLAARGSWARQDSAMATALLEYMSHGKIEIDPERMIEIARKALGHKAEEEMTTFAQ